MNITKVSPSKLSSRSPQRNKNSSPISQDYDDSINNSNDYRPLPKTPEDESSIRFSASNNEKNIPENDNNSAGNVDQHEFSKRYCQFKGDIEKLKYDITSARRLSSQEYFGLVKQPAPAKKQASGNSKAEYENSIGIQNSQYLSNKDGYQSEKSCYSHIPAAASHDQKFLAQLNEKMNKLAFGDSLPFGKENYESNSNDTGVNKQRKSDSLSAQQQSESMYKYSRMDYPAKNEKHLNLQYASEDCGKENYESNSNDQQGIFRDRKLDNKCFYQQKPDHKQPRGEYQPSVAEGQQVKGEVKNIIQGLLKCDTKQNIEPARSKNIDVQSILEVTKSDLNKLQNPEEALELLCFYKIELAKALQRGVSQDVVEKIRLQNRAIEQLKAELTRYDEELLMKKAEIARKDEELHARRSDIQQLKNQINMFRQEIEELQNQSPSQESERIIAALSNFFCLCIKLYCVR